jgi:MiaB/RimO family radical SAM methylthiotransferase
MQSVPLSKLHLWKRELKLSADQKVETMRQGKKHQNIFFSTTFKLCDNNGYLSTQIYNFFVLNGHELTDEPDAADVIVISTCGFDQARESTSISIVDQYVRNYSANKKIIICGCLTKINPGLFDVTGVTLIGPKELHRFNEIFNPAIKIEDISGSQLNEQFISAQYGFIDAYYLQVCQGCVNNCSYCAIKTAKGFVTSKPIDQVIGEVEQGMRKGYERFMLLADDCGSYGADFGGDFSDLLNSLENFDIRISINYIEPKGFQKLYPKIHKKVFNRIEFMNIPVQSTSERILGLMNRHYHVDDITQIVGEIKRDFPGIYLETHVIYGFPGETREEFRDFFRLSRHFDSVIYFYYTDRKNVKASLLPGKLSADEMIDRTGEIMRHRLFTREAESATPPLVLLGYGLSESELFESIRQEGERIRIAAP